MFRYIKTLLVILMLPLGACHNTPITKTNTIENEIKLLKTADGKSLFLKNIFAEDQGVRDGSNTGLALKYGKNSKELREYGDKQITQSMLGRKSTIII